MTALVSVLEGRATVEWGKFGLIDEDRVEPGEPGWLALGSPDTMVTGKNGAAFRSGGAFHEATVRLEAWTAEPPSAGGDWDAVWEDDITLTSGVVRLVAVTSWTDDRTLRVGPGGLYRLRVHSRGRAAARTGGDRPNLGEVFEYWLLRFWPG